MLQDAVLVVICMSVAKRPASGCGVIRGLSYSDIQLRMEWLPLIVTTINLEVGSTAIRPWMSVRTPENVFAVLAPLLVTVGQTPAAHVTA